LEKQANTRLYEGMFLVSSSRAARDWEGTLKTIRTILERADCRIVSMDKWDERRLAYDIKGHGRGTYILSFFEADARKIKGIERDVLLSDRILRALILRGNYGQKTPATEGEAPPDAGEKAAPAAAKDAESAAEGASVEAEQIN
jgi:ribosomal protein S6